MVIRNGGGEVKRITVRVRVSVRVRIRVSAGGRVRV